MPDMLAVRKTGPGPGMKLERVPVPSIGPTDVLLRVKATSICGTDLHIYDWDPWAQTNLKTPLTVGHEFCGEVVEAGRDVRRLKAGDFVSVESHIPCGQCPQCLRDLMHICDRVKIFGIDRDGSYAEFVSVPEICGWKHGRPMEPELASIMEPLGNAVHVADTAPTKGADLAIFGCGPQGLFAIAVARAEGAKRIFAVEPNPNRRELALRMKPDEILGDGDPVAALKDRTGGSGVDVVFEMSGAPAAFKAGLRCLRPGGTLIAFGIPGRPIEIDLDSDIIMKGRRVIGVVGRHMFRTWEKMQALLDSGRLDPRPVITHRLKLSEVEKGFAAIRSKTEVCGKVVMFP